MGGMEAEAEQTFAKAIELAEAAKRKNPRDPWIHSDLALYYAKTDNREWSLQQLETALVLAPESGDIMAAAAEALELLGAASGSVCLLEPELGELPGDVIGRALVAVATSKATFHRVAGER